MNLQRHENALKCIENHQKKKSSDGQTDKLITRFFIFERKCTLKSIKNVQNSPVEQNSEHY